MRGASNLVEKQDVFVFQDQRLNCPKNCKIFNMISTKKLSRDLRGSFIIGSKIIGRLKRSPEKC